MRAALVWSLLVALAPLAGGQDQERYELSWLARDRATFVVDIQLGEATTRRLVEGQPDDAARRAAVELWAAQQLAAWSGRSTSSGYATAMPVEIYEGPVAWEPIEVVIDDRVHLRATAWFTPAPGLLGPRSTPRLEERRDGVLRVRLGWRGGAEADGSGVLDLVERLDGGGLASPSARETLRLGSAGIAEVRSAIGALLVDDTSERTLVVRPGPVTKVTRALRLADASLSVLTTLRPVDGALGAPARLEDGVALVETPALRAQRADRHLEALQTLARDVEAGARTLDQAVAALEARVIVARTELTVEQLADDPAAVDSFTRGLEAARAAWAASPWRERVEQAATPVPLAGVEPLGPLAPAKAQAPAAPSVETAPVLAPGEHALSCDLEAWGRIEARAGQTVRVEVRPQGDVDLDLELWADGATRRELVASSAAGTPVEAASWRVAKDGPVWARVWKGTGRFTLVVRVE